MADLSNRSQKDGRSRQPFPKRWPISATVPKKMADLGNRSQKDGRSRQPFPKRWPISAIFPPDKMHSIFVPLAPLPFAKFAKFAFKKQPLVPLSPRLLICAFTIAFASYLHYLCRTHTLFDILPISHILRKYTLFSRKQYNS